MSEATPAVDETDAVGEPPKGERDPTSGAAELSGSETPSSAGRRWSIDVDRAWFFPAAVLVLLVVLSAFGVNGSSISGLTGRPGGDGSVLAGNPRAIRSDEFLVRTPFVVGQERRGFPSTAEIGVGEHDLTVLVDLPTRDWAMLFRPHQWAYGILPIDQAYAFDWWGLSAVLLLGTYGLLLVLTGRWSWAAIGAVAFWASPFFHWWYLALSLAVAGYGLGGVALLLASMRAGLSARARWLLVAASAYVSSCFALTFYPPFQMPLALVLIATAIGFVAQRLGEGWTDWRTVATNSAVAGGVTAAVFGLFVITRMETLSAIMNTAYPGERRVDGGGANTGLLASSWFGLEFVQEPDTMRTKVLANESEGSSFLLLGAFLLPALPILWSRIAGPGRRMRGVLVGALVGFGLVAAHMFVGLPTFLAKTTLLDRVPADRAIVGLGLASILVVVLAGVAMQEEMRELGPVRRVAAAAITVFFATGYVLALGSRFIAADAPVGRRAILAAMVGVSVVVGLYFWRPLLGALGLAVAGVVVSLPVNPLTTGLDTITDAPLTRAIERLAGADDSGSRWLNTMEMSNPAVAAAGVDDLSAVNLYPDHEAWEALDEDGSEEEIWNRYSHTRWLLDPSVAEPVVALLSNDVVSVTVDPCDPVLDEFDVGHIITSAPIDAVCLTLVERTTALDGAPALIYRRASSDR